MTDDERIADLNAELEQHRIAESILLGMYRLTVDKPGVIEEADAGNYLRIAANERERQGDFGAARLLDEWADGLDAAREDEP